MTRSTALLGTMDHETAVADIAATRMLRWTGRDRTQIASFHVVFVELNLAAPPSGCEEQSLVIGRPGQGQRVERRSLDRLDLARARPVEHQTTWMLRQPQLQRGRDLGAKMGLDLSQRTLGRLLLARRRGR